MGASGWAYFVPYQADISQALQALREEVFRRGEYYRPAEWYAWRTPDRVIIGGEADGRAPMPEPETILELLEMNGSRGTHSILDIQAVARVPFFAVAAPLNPQQLLDLFGTDEPSRPMVEWAALILQMLRRRWEGTYVIVYRQGAPDEILFTGCSGD